MDILVVHASKHGSTAIIAQQIAAHLVERGHHVTIFDAETADDLDEAAIAQRDAVVIGSAIYAGRWLKPARRFIDHHAAELADTPVWLFSSGPLADDPKPEDEPIEVRHLEEQLGVRGHRVFNGAIDRSELNLIERAVVKMIKEPDGDYRHPEDIRAWTDEIADALV